MQETTQLPVLDGGLHREQGLPCAFLYTLPPTYLKSLPAGPTLELQCNPQTREWLPFSSMAPTVDMISQLEHLLFPSLWGGRYKEVEAFP